jgi:IS4 transposase
MKSSDDYPDHLRRVRYRDPILKRLSLCSPMNFTLSALTVTELYRLRWKVELFFKFKFKWIKQHLRIKAPRCFEWVAVR